MRIVSINVALPEIVRYRGRETATAIFKKPIEGPVHLRFLNFDGDRQADPRYHGGMNKAVYGYASEHYEFWKREFPEKALPWGAFGENLTVEGGLFENVVCIGDRFALGMAEIVAVQPRLPCSKLNLRFGTHTMIRRFLKANRFGVYFKVVREGVVAPGDSMKLIHKDPRSLTVAELGKVFTTEKKNVSIMERAVMIPDLPEEHLRHFLEFLGASDR